MIQVHVSPQRIHENRYSHKGGDQPTISIKHADSMPEWAHELVLYDSHGTVVARLCSDMSDTPAGPTSVWLEVYGRYEAIHRRS